MEVTIAKVCGLCAGCKRAILTAKEELEKGKSVTIFKEIVHNPTVNSMLKNAGVKFEEDINKLNKDGVVIIRAHGEPPKTYKYLKDNKIRFRDCTCFNVEDIHKNVENFSNRGYTIAMLGKHNHPEVVATMGWANDDAIIIESEEDLVKLNNINNKIYLVCQTTFNVEKAEKLIDEISDLTKRKNIELIVNKSICSVNKLINESSKELAKNSDVMIVVGGKNSSNTNELYLNLLKLCSTIFIEDIHTYKHELERNNIVLKTSSRIGLTAGASTMTEELEELRQLILNDYK